MKKTLLNGRCDLYFYDSNCFVADTPNDLNNIAVKKLPSTIPSNVEFALSENGILPNDLFYSTNILKNYAFEQSDFWYEKSFNITANQLQNELFLEFDGVDTIATYFLNDIEIGQSKNMFIAHTFKINDYARVGNNTLFVKLASAVKYAATKEFPPYISALPVNQESAWLRKAPHSFGWDIMPRAVSAGIWRDVFLVEKTPYEIEDIYLTTTHLDKQFSSALVWFNYNVKMPTNDYNKTTLRITGVCGDSNFDIKTVLRFKNGTFRITVDKNLKLWWPLGYGEQNLYDINIEIIKDDIVVASKQQKLGIRLVNINYSEEGGAKGFFNILVNHTQIMIKGTNWVPADAFHSRDQQRILPILNEIKQLGCNCIRCWGGNVYEDDRFFDYCDENGILVWQDFAMACSQYPHDQEFLDEIANEIKQTAIKLRNHCSLALYCGDNECDIMTFYNALDPNTNVITRRTIPEALSTWDPFRKFIPSSPYISPLSYAQDNASHLPEMHLWGPRDNFKSMFYREDSCNFIGEIGYHGCTNISSIKKFISSDKIWPPYDNIEWIAHCTAPDGNGINSIYAYRVQLMANQIRELFGEVPSNIEDFVLASQISQAEAKKFFIEYARQKKWSRTGIIWWNAMDGWPQFSDAVIDYYFVKKLACYYIKRSQMPITIIMKEPDNWTCDLIIGNDSNVSANGTYQVIDADDDAVVASGNFYSRANENTLLEKIPVSNGIQKLYLLKATINGQTVVNHYLHGHTPFNFAKYKKQLSKIAALDNSFDSQLIGK